MGRKQFKLSLLGEGAVGKTSLKARFISGEYTDKYISTLGVDFANHELKIDGQKVNISIWDVAGQKHFQAIRKSFFEGSRGGLFIYDVTRKDTFTALDANWVRPFWDHLQEKVPCIVLANKIDLIEQRKVTRDEGIAYASMLAQETGFGVPYVETSAKDGTNVVEAFENLARAVLDRFNT